MKTRREKVLEYIYSDFHQVLRLIRNKELGTEFVTDGGYCISELAHEYLVYGYTRRKKRLSK